MGRPVPWASDIYMLRERATRSSIETWSRQDIEHLFGVRRVSAQTLMRAIGQVQTVGGAHFVSRGALLEFLTAMLAPPSVAEALQERILNAEPAPRPRPLRVELPPDLRHAMMPDLPQNILVEPGRIEIRADNAVAMLESLMTLALAMQNDLDRFRAALDRPSRRRDGEVTALVQRIRGGKSR